MRVNRAPGAGLLVVVLWASAFPAIRTAAPAMGVIGLSFTRLLIATLALLVLAVARKARLPRVRDLGWILACGFFGMTAYQLLLNRGELYVPAGTASIIVAAAPLVVITGVVVVSRAPGVAPRRAAARTRTSAKLPVSCPTPRSAFTTRRNPQ